MLVWFFELLCVTLICTMYALFFFFLMYCEKSNYTCRFQTQNSILAKSFGTYLFVSMVTIEVLEGVHLFQDFSCNTVTLLSMKFLKIMCSTVSPLIYFRKLIKFYKPWSCTVKHEESSIILQDSLPLITFRSASFLMTGSDGGKE